MSMSVLTSTEVEMCVCPCNDLATKATWRIHLQHRTKGVWYERRGDGSGSDGGDVGGVVHIFH